jgi:hypothetical protein
MNDPFRTPEDYELYLYTLTEKFTSIKRSTVTLIRLGSTLARVAGELFLGNNFRIVVRERVLFDRLPIVLDWYGYEVYRGDEKLYWYDSQPHPTNEPLQTTHPHHKHIPPDIKNNRIPAENMSFTQPNLPALISEIESL